MEAAKDEIIMKLKQHLQQKDDEIQNLRELLGKAVDKVENNKKDDWVEDNQSLPVSKHLTNLQIERYSRQLLLPEIGVEGQKKLSSLSVLIVGAGGLGCPAGIYLAAAGIGNIGIIDYDDVEMSNLHRQILHSECSIGISKVHSFTSSIHRVNSSVKVVPYKLILNSNTAIEIIGKYHIILDASDNVATRYLLNDACVLLKKPLVSGSALRFEGQLTVYNHKDGPCYRCLFPNPPPPETVANCSDGGVLGAVPGVIGCLQSIEAVKLALGLDVYSQRMLLFDALTGLFRTIQLRGKRHDCEICGTNPSITELIDYEQFCGAAANDKDIPMQLLSPHDAVSVTEYKQLLNSGTAHVLVDVRNKTEVAICRLPHAVNIPYTEICANVNSAAEKIVNLSGSCYHPVYFVCHIGRDSQKSIVKLKSNMNCSNITLKNINGGLAAWSKFVDSTFPVY